MAERGFDILTYKTVRTKERKVHKFPNWAFISDPSNLRDRNFEEPLVAEVQYWASDPTEVTMVNSFGIPSSSPSIWQPDVVKAKAALGPRQVLIVSVVGTTPSSEGSLDNLIDDFVRAAELAKEAGADIVELNFSCPNIPGHREGEVYRSPEISAAITQAVREAIRDTPIFMKIGYLDEGLLSSVVHANAHFVQGVVAINTVSMRVKNVFGDDFFPSSRGYKRSTAGISGSSIKPLAMEVVRNLGELRKKFQYDFDILAVGGVTTGRDVQEYLNLGANGVQSCTGAWINPNLAIETRLYTGTEINDKFVTVVGNGDNGGPRQVEKKEHEWYATRPASEIMKTPEQQEQRQPSREGLPHEEARHLEKVIKQVAQEIDEEVDSEDHIYEELNELRAITFAEEHIQKGLFVIF